MLRAKLYSMRLEEETSKRYTARKVQVGCKTNIQIVYIIYMAVLKIIDAEDLCCITQPDKSDRMSNRCL